MNSYWYKLSDDTRIILYAHIYFENLGVRATNTRALQQLCRGRERNIVAYFRKHRAVPLEKALEVPKELNDKELEILQKIDYLLLDFLDLESIDDFAFLSRQIRYLYLAINCIENIDVLADFKELVYLCLWRNAIVDYRPIAELHNLEFLNLRSNWFYKDWSFLSTLKNLKTLILDEAGLEDDDLAELVETIKQLPKLENLYLCANNFKNIEPLFSLQQIREISLYENSIPEKAIQALATHLPNVLIHR